LERHKVPKPKGNFSMTQTRKSSKRSATGSSQAIDHQTIDFSNKWIQNYHFIKKLGSGSFATVWRADDCDPNRLVLRPVAIKVFIGVGNKLQKAYEDFRADLRVLARIGTNAPIVQYYNHLIEDLFIDGDAKPHTDTTRHPRTEAKGVPVTAFLLIMEFADGGPLDQNYRQQQVIQGDGVTYLGHFIDVCSALQSAHDQGVMHRDIKPSNLLWFRNTNLVKIGDFGIAKNLNEDAIPGMVIEGSRAYMAPECFAPGSAATPERDIYALGCTFYELLTGELAFDPDRSPQTIDLKRLGRQEAYEHLHRNTPRPDAVIRAPGKVSVDLSATLNRMMSVAPGDRPSLKQVIKALENEKDGAYKNRPSLSDFEGIKVPQEPIYRSLYDVNPDFRFEQLGESLFFVFFNFGIRTPYRYKVLFGLSDAFFEDAYTICETFGKYEWLLRVWAPRDGELINEFCQHLVGKLLENRTDNLRVMQCEHAVYPQSTIASAGLGSKSVEALIKLNQAQNAGTESAIHWLKRKGIYVRKTERSVKGSPVKCFSLIKNMGDGSKHERDSKMALILQELRRTHLIDRVKELSVHRRAFQNVTRYSAEHSDYLISYVVDRFDDAIKVPGLILDRIDGQVFETSTLLATERFLVYSDRVRTKWVQPDRT